MADWQYRVVPESERTASDGPWFRGQYYLTNRWLTCAVCGTSLAPGMTIERDGQHSHVGCGARDQKRRAGR